MQKFDFRLTTLAFVVVLSCSALARAQAAKDLYPAMAPLDQYLMADETAEIALARTAAPAAISGAADVMVLHKDGYATVAKGSNGFVCIVERSWAKESDEPEHWNPKMRAPTCYNAAAAKTYLTIYLMKTRLVLAGKSPAEAAAAVASALDKKELPALAPGAMCYMMSKQQYLSDRDKGWHPHTMVFVAGDAVKSWGADADAAPMYAGYVHEGRVTVFMFVADQWSDGTPGPGMVH